MLHPLAIRMANPHDSLERSVLSHLYGDSTQHDAAITVCSIQIYQRRDGASVQIKESCVVWRGGRRYHAGRTAALGEAHRSTPTSKTSEATQKEHGAALEQQVASASSNASDLQAEISRLQKEVEESKGTVESLERTGNWIWSGEDRTCCCQGSFQILSRCFMRSCSLLLVAATKKALATLYVSWILNYRSPLLQDAANRGGKLCFSARGT